MIELFKRLSLLLENKLSDQAFDPSFPCLSSELHWKRYACDGSVSTETNSVPSPSAVSSPVSPLQYNLVTIFRDQKYTTQHQ